MGHFARYANFPTIPDMDVGVLCFFTLLAFTGVKFFFTVYGYKNARTACLNSQPFRTRIKVRFFTTGFLRRPLIFTFCSKGKRSSWLRARRLS